MHEGPYWYRENDTVQGPRALDIIRARIGAGRMDGQSPLSTDGVNFKPAVEVLGEEIFANTRVRVQPAEPVTNVGQARPAAIRPQTVPRRSVDDRQLARSAFIVTAILFAISFSGIGPSGVRLTASIGWLLSGSVGLYFYAGKATRKPLVIALAATFVLIAGGLVVSMILLKGLIEFLQKIDWRY